MSVHGVVVQTANAVSSGSPAAAQSSIGNATVIPGSVTSW